MAVMDDEFSRQKKKGHNKDIINSKTENSS